MKWAMVGKGKESDGWEGRNSASIDSNPDKVTMQISIASGRTAASDKRRSR